MRTLLLLFTFLLSLSAFAQEEKPRAELRLEKPSVRAGETVRGVVVVTFAPGLHGYQNPPSLDYQIPVKVEAEKGTTLLKAKYPTGIPFRMQGETEDSLVYEGTIEIPIEIKAPANGGKAKVELVVRYQQCDDSSCFPPGTLRITGELTVQQTQPERPRTPMFKFHVKTGTYL
jgi:uncharacterized protein